MSFRPPYGVQLGQLGQSVLDRGRGGAGAGRRRGDGAATTKPRQQPPPGHERRAESTSRASRDYALTNKTPASPDAPTLASAERFGSSGIRLTFSKDLKQSQGGIPDDAAFTVTVDDANRAAALHLDVPLNPRNFVLILSGSPLDDRSTVRVSYDPSRAGGRTKAIQDTGGNGAGGFKNALVKTDLTAPTLESASVKGTELALTYDEALYWTRSSPVSRPPACEGCPPPGDRPRTTSAGTTAASAFTVKGIGADQTPSAVSVSGRVVTLTLARGVRAGQSVTVSYARPADNPLRDAAGNHAADLTDRAVTNNTARVGPLPTRIEATAQDVYLHFGRDIRTGSTGTHPMSGERCPALQAFTLKVDGAPRGSWATRGVEGGPTGGNGLDGWRAKCDARMIHLELWNVPPRAYLIPPGATVSLSYDPNVESGTIAYADDSVVPAFTDMAVENNRAYLSWTNVEGSSLLAYFGLELDTASVPPPSAFTVTVGGERRDVTGVSFFGLYSAGVKLTLESPVYSGDEVTLSYDPPSSGALRSKSKGRPVPDFSGQWVTNESTGSGGASGNTGPSPTSSSVSGTQLKMTFDGTLSQGLAPPGGSFKVTSEPGGGAGGNSGAGANGGTGAQATSGGGTDDIPGTGTTTVDGAEVAVTLARAPAPGATLTVAYAPPDDSTSALRGLGGGKVEEFSGEPVTQAAARPAVAAVAVVSDAGGDGTYALGQTIRVAVRFSEAVTVTGSPVISIDMDPAAWGEKRAAYAGGSGTAELVFAHEVVEPNVSTEGIAVLADSLALNGGSIRSASGAGRGPRPWRPRARCTSQGGLDPVVQPGSGGGRGSAALRQLHRDRKCAAGRAGDQGLRGHLQRPGWR